MKEIDRIARERCEKLLRLAREVQPREPELARRYVRLARKIAQRHRFPLGSREFCRKCSTVWAPGRTLKVRLAGRGKTALYTCLACRYTRRFPYAVKRARV
jgi:ribonuclease P protein subunit RPR2